MIIRHHILVVLLWLSVIALSTWVGGTLYQMLVITECCSDGGGSDELNEITEAYTGIT